MNVKMRDAYRLLLTGLMTLAMALAARPAMAVTTEQGQARLIPWSGYWWPLRRGGILKPLSKYDQATGAQAATWERERHPVRPDTPAWHGYCHAWAASSVMEKEPRRTHTAATTSGSPLELGVGDKKALLAACHAQDVANAYGDRYGDGDGSEDPQDLAPESLWHLLRLYVKEHGVPLILDLEPGPDVWNYPVYAYEIQYAPQGDAGVRLAHLSLLMADNSVPPDYVGVKVNRQTYQFTFQLRDGAVVMGSGRWAGSSREDHPDFAWYPHVAVPENPEVQHALVQQLVAGAASSVPSPSSPPPPAPDAPRDALPISPWELVALIAEKTSSFGLDVTIDRFDGAHYRPGEKFSLRGASERAGYLYLLLIDSAGELTLLYPLPGRDNRVPAQSPFVIPVAGEHFPIRAAWPAGTCRIKALVATRPLALTGLLAPVGKMRPTNAPGDAVAAQTFRWHPTQRDQIRKLLKHYGNRQPVSREQLGLSDPRSLLGPFAQDEVAFYVEPAAGAKQKPANPGKPAPSASQPQSVRH